jgi:hypothetical protein
MEVSMKEFLKSTALAGCVILAAGVACGKPKAIKPGKPVPAGTVLLQFTKKVQGPVDLTIDGMRIPVQNVAKKGKHLVISGLANGKHHIVLLSAKDAFGPDQLDMELTEGHGEFKVLFSQQFNSVLYGKPEPTPAAEGIPGVVARLQP